MRQQVRGQAMGGTEQHRLADSKHGDAQQKVVGDFRDQAVTYEFRV